MKEKRLVVVGASLAGLRAVEGVRKAGFTGPITLIGAEEILPYDRPPLSKSFLYRESVVEVPYFKDKDALVGELRIELLLGTPASGLDTAGRTVAVGEREIPYDGLVIATGSTARRLPGTEHLAGVYTLRTLDDARAVRAALRTQPRTVVIGAGFIGSEVAASARKLGLEVTIVEAAQTPLLRSVGAEMGPVCAALHQANGTDLRCGVAVAAIEGPGRVEQVRLADGTVLAADLVVVGAGADPATDWLSGSGLTLDNGVVCDETLSAGPAGVYAAGDVARWYNPLFERHMRLEHWHSAAEQGVVAATAAVSGSPESYQTVPYFWSDWYKTRIQFAGAPEADEIAVVRGDTESGRFLALYRTGDRLTGALGLNQQREVMRYRTLIGNRTSWSEALDLVDQRTLVSANPLQ